MKCVILRATICVLSLGLNVLAQPGESLDDRIKSLTDNIAKLEAAVVSPSMQAVHRQMINDQRIDLVALLGQKKGEIQSYLDTVGSNLLPEQRTKLAAMMEGLDNQIGIHKKALKGELLASESASTSGAAVPDSSVRNAPESSPVSGNGRGSTPGGSIPSPPSVAPAATSDPLSPLNSTLPIAPASAPSAGSASCSAVLLAPSSYTIREQQICALVQDVVNNKALVPSSGIALDGAETFIVNIISQAKNVADIEDRRTDKQTGSDPQASGTTSLVVKGGTPAVLSWAVENGAAVATTSGTTINFRFNPLGIIHALGDIGYFPSYDESEKDPFAKFLRKTSFGVSFDASRGSQPGVFTGNKQQISAFSARYEFVSDRDPRNRKYADEWENLVDTSQIDYTNAAVRLRAAIVDPPHCLNPLLNPCPAGQLVPARFKDAVLQNWLDETNKMLSTIQPPAGAPANTVIAAVEDVIWKQVGALSVDKTGTITRNQIMSFLESLNSYLTAREKLLDKIAKGKIMSFEYTNRREVNAPDTSSFTFIAEKGTVKRMDLTFNASLTMYNQRPAGLNVKRIRDFVFAGQFDAPLREISGVGLPVFSIAGRYERATGDAFALDGTLVPNTKGDVGSVQLKLLLPIKGTGVRLPLSVTFANRTALIREREVRTNFGFTFDLDRLFSNNPFFKN